MLIILKYYFEFIHIIFYVYQVKLKMMSSFLAMCPTETSFAQRRTNQELFLNYK